uniref:28S ribosomal protein S28, mitochondrial n=1 Tax=Cacopsylla melanoneura TaxID=428564 RepID=A0A8D8LP72_9HEMI
MLSRKVLSRVLQHQCKIKPLRMCFSTETPQTPSQDDKAKVSGFAKAFEKYTAPEPVKEDKDIEFAKLFRNSKLVDLGDPENKVVYGKIFHVVDDDLYIDFGGKFHTVCVRPRKNADDYVRGAKVRLLLKDTELSTKFLGAEKDLTILEADAILLGVVKRSIAES